MNELRVDIGGSSRGFQIATEDTKRMARDLQRSMEGYTPDTFKGAQAMRDQYGKVFNEVKGQGGFGGLASSISVATAALAGMYEVGKKLWETLKGSFQLWRDAQTLGLSTTGLQKLDQAGNQQGFDPGEARGRMSRFTNKVGEAAGGDKSAQGFFKDMGVEIQGKTMEEILNQVAEAFNRIQDPAERARRAVELFGRGGQEMISILKQMKEGGGWFSGFVSDEQTDAVLGGTWKKIHGFFSNLKDLIKAGSKSYLADFIEGYTGYQGEVQRPAKVKVQESDADKAEKAKAAAKAVKDLAEAQKEYHREVEATADPQIRLAMQMGDRDELEMALKKAEAAHDEVEALKIKTELLAKNKQIQDGTKALADAAKKPEKPEHKADVSRHVDSLSGAGLFTSAGAVMNPLVDISYKQLLKLTDINNAINALNNNNIFSP